MLEFAQWGRGCSTRGASISRALSVSRRQRRQGGGALLGGVQSSLPAAKEKKGQGGPGEGGGAQALPTAATFLGMGKEETLLRPCSPGTK